MVGIAPSLTYGGEELNRVTSRQKECVLDLKYDTRCWIPTSQPSSKDVASLNERNILKNTLAKRVVGKANADPRDNLLQSLAGFLNVLHRMGSADANTSARSQQRSGGKTNHYDSQLRRIKVSVLTREQQQGKARTPSFKHSLENAMTLGT